MKNISFYLMICVFMLSLLVSPVSAITQDGHGGALPDDPVKMWPETHPHVFYFYHDSEHTQQILSSDELEVGQKVYYEVISAEGFYLDHIRSTASEFTQEYFILDDINTTIPNLLPRSILAGDFNNDLHVDLKDVAWILRYCSGWKDTDEWVINENFVAGDYNRDGKIDNRDISDILRMLTGLEEKYGGVQEDFQVIDEFQSIEIKYVKTPLGEEGIKIVNSAEDFRAYWEDIDTVSMYTDTESPFDKEGMLAEYNEEFFESHTVVIAAVNTSYTETYVYLAKDGDGHKAVYRPDIDSDYVKEGLTVREVLVYEKNAIAEDAVLPIEGKPLGFFW